MMRVKTRQDLTYMRLVTAAGAAVVAHSALRFDPSVIDLQFLLLFSFAVLVGPRVGVSIPKTRAEVTASDTFVFLAMLLYGGEAAVLLAASEAFCSSFRLSPRWLTRFCNAGLLASSTFLTVSALRLCFGRVEDLPAGPTEAPLVLAALLMALVQYATNTGLAAVRDSLRSGLTPWRAWRENYAWVSVSCFAGASAAAVVARASALTGIYPFAVALPVVIVIYFTYWSHRRNVASTERFASELREREENFRSAFDNAAGMAVVSPAGRWLQVNTSLCRLLGYSERELLGLDVRQVVHPEDLGPFLAEMGELLAGAADGRQSERRLLDGRGRAVWVLSSASVVRKSEDGASRLIFQIQDITDRKLAEERLQHDAFHDALTGLPNRALFADHLVKAIERTRLSPGHLFAVLFLDFDRFKVINDSLGHLMGDRLLVEVAARLQGCVRPADTVARLGGDEFTVLLDDLARPDEAEAVVARIQAAVARPFDLGGHEVYTSASIGVALSTVGYASAEEVLRDADTAMYKAKQAGKARHVVFDPEMHSTAVELLSLETDLRRAAERGELTLHYQPVVSLAGRGLVGFEALVRWRHPRRGVVQPAEFIPLAEETGLILQIGEWVLTEACRQLKEWRDKWAAAHELSVSVNLSGRQFTQPDLVERVVCAAQRAGLPLRCLNLEVTESLLMENIETAAGKLEVLRQLGVEISIDDFGTGYSSLSYLHRLPIDTLKVDRSFVTRMGGGDENAEIVRTVVALAKSMGMKVVAEGVETTGQEALLRELGCDAGQGFLFSCPVGAEEAEALLPKESGGAAWAGPAGAPAPASGVREVGDGYAM
jgi:diguanylate cyclase (GGDEF)-like protein/PAS domain S-box-containing protein